MPQTAAKLNQNQLPVSLSTSSTELTHPYLLGFLASWLGGELPKPVKLAWCLEAAQGMGWSPLWDASRGGPHSGMCPRDGPRSRMLPRGGWVVFCTAGCWTSHVGLAH